MELFWEFASVSGESACVRGSLLTQAAAAAAESAGRGPETLWVSSCPDTTGSLAGTWLRVLASGLDNLCFICWLLPPQDCESLIELLCLTVCPEQGVVSGESGCCLGTYPPRPHYQVTSVSGDWPSPPLWMDSELFTP